jgi:hypothetical protein
LVLNIEDVPVRGTQVQDWSSPFNIIALRVDSLACFGECCVDRIAIRNRHVELTRESNRGLVRNLELHRDHGGNPLLK